MRLILCLFVGLLACASLAAPAAAYVKLPDIFSDGMVLQRGAAVPVWGQAQAGEKITASIAGHAAKATADASGRFSLTLPAMPAGGPYCLKVTGRNEIVLNDVLIGDVWLCSGQSNMALNLAEAEGGTAAAAQARDKELRFFIVPESILKQAADSRGARWRVCSPEAAAPFSAVGYFFGVELRKKLTVPVGLIQATYGGTPLDAWMSRQVLNRYFNYSSELAKWDRYAINYPKLKRQYAERLIDWRESSRLLKSFGLPAFAPPKPPPNLSMMGHASSLWDSMITGLLPLPIKGVIWNQGEADVGLADRYRVLFPALVEDWRRQWSSKDLPFYFVQLHNWDGPKSKAGRSPIAELREAQQATCVLPHTGMIVTVDLGGADHSIHYKRKEEVGKRLACAVLACEYGLPCVWQGPVFDVLKIEGDKIRVHFKHTDGGLKTSDGKPPSGFAVAGDDCNFIDAAAAVDGEDVVLSSRITRPVHVRYAWQNDPQVNLTNGFGLPASPFRTDRQP
jgi:sialate O-acetylesterase